nr:hypothetical protein MGR_3549 [Magnetospirillum gryphiswaldense MSR-1]
MPRLQRCLATEEFKMNEAKNRSENAKAIKHCLDYLAREARESDLREVAELIEVACLAAEDASETVH